MPGTLLSYQKLEHHGHGVVQFIPDRPERAARAGREVHRYGGRRFTFTDYHYYRFPEPETLPLNRILHRIVSESDYRAEFVRDRARVVAAAGLRPEEATARRSARSRCPRTSSTSRRRRPRTRRRRSRMDFVAAVSAALPERSPEMWPNWSSQMLYGHVAP